MPIARATLTAVELFPCLGVSEYRANVQELDISVYVMDALGMQLIKFTLSGADGENLGSFTLDPYAQLCLMADARANPKLSLTEYVRESIRAFTLNDAYEGTIHCRGDNGEEVAAISAELATAK